MSAEPAVRTIDAHTEVLNVEREARKEVGPSGPVYRRLSDIQARPIRWLWPGYFALGKVGVVAGNPGLGKSQITTDMAAVVSTGGRWPVDRSICEAGNVIFLSAEDDPEDTIRPRLEAAGADLTRCFILDAVTEGYNADGTETHRAFNLKTDLANLGVMLDLIGGAALIVIDPITAYLGNADSHKNAEIRALLSPLADLAAAHSAAVVCVSHLNKTGGGGALMRVTGSLAFVAAARGAYVVTKDPENDDRRLFLPLKNNLGNDKTGLSFAIESVDVPSPAGTIASSRVIWGLDLVTVSADQAMIPAEDEDGNSIEDAKEFLVELLAAGAVQSRQVMSNATEAGFKEKMIRRAQKALGIKPVREGGLAAAGKWFWRLPAKLPDGPNLDKDSHTNGRGNIGTLAEIDEYEAGPSVEAEL